MLMLLTFLVWWRLVLAGLLVELVRVTNGRSGLVGSSYVSKKDPLRGLRMGEARRAGEVLPPPPVPRVGDMLLVGDDVLPRVGEAPRAGDLLRSVDAECLGDCFGDDVGLLLSSSGPPKKDPLKGLRMGDCRVLCPSVRLVRRGERSGLCRDTFHGDWGGVALGVQICVSDVTRRLQWGHLPDMKFLLPTVEYLDNGYRR